MVVLKNDINIDLFHVSELSDQMNVSQLNLIDIKISDTFEYKVHKVEGPSDIKHIEVGSTYFINYFLNNSNSNTSF
jgi:hypothetical protein